MEVGAYTLEQGRASQGTKVTGVVSGLRASAMYYADFLATVTARRQKSKNKGTSRNCRAFAEEKELGQKTVQAVLHSLSSQDRHSFPVVSHLFLFPFLTQDLI